MTTLEERQQVVALVQEATASGARQAQACAVLGWSERTLQRWLEGETVGCDQRPLRQSEPPHKLTAAERAELLAVANSTEFGHLPPSQIVPRLADQGRYLASESTFYRVLKAENQSAHRRSERPPQARRKPKAICATAPNQVYSWDITYLPTAIRGQFFHLYLFLDIFSRKIVGWQVYDTECSTLASALLKDICQREAIGLHQATLHADHGGPMKGATMLATLQALGVMSSFSRPAVSNDNPYSESLFKTLNTVLTTRQSRLSISSRPGVGSITWCAGTTTSTATARSASSPPPSVMQDSTDRSWHSVKRSTKTRAERIRSAGAERPEIGNASRSFI